MDINSQTAPAHTHTAMTASLRHSNTPCLFPPSAGTFWRMSAYHMSPHITVHVFTVCALPGAPLQVRSHMARRDLAGGRSLQVLINERSRAMRVGGAGLVLRRRSRRRALRRW